MKIRCKCNGFVYIAKYEVFELIKEKDGYYYIKTRNNGERWYHMAYFDIVTPTLEEQLEQTQKELERLQQLIKEKNTPKVGDKYKHCSAGVYTVVSVELNGKTLYALIREVGSQAHLYTHFNTNIDNIFAEFKHLFTKF